MLCYSPTQTSARKHTHTHTLKLIRHIEERSENTHSFWHPHAHSPAESGEQGGNSHERNCIFGEDISLRQAEGRRKGGKDAQKLSICSFKEHVIAFLTKDLSLSLSLWLSLSHNPLNHSQRPLRHQNPSQTTLKLGDLLLSKKLNHSVLTDRS